MKKLFENHEKLLKNGLKLTGIMKTKIIVQGQLHYFFNFRNGSNSTSNFQNKCEKITPEVGEKYV